MDQYMLELLTLTGICPILANAEPDIGVPCARALMEGGLPVLEVLLKNEVSVQNIAAIAKELPGMIVGAGTVLTPDQAERVIDLGAKFLVLPGYSQKVVDVAQRHGIPVVPGCVTPTEIMMALDNGIDIVKFFPVYEMGGVKTLAQLNGGPFPGVRFVVTGGLDGANFLPLLQHKGVLAAGGDWMFQEQGALARRDFRQISANMRHSIMNVVDMRNNG
ncbi:MAG: bifunctional 4-hydroxy-2-oxoglutarate aldolase/2-dehydro-3-deoxy-phosphogluconate aldolase [Candidatus Excrementavichristensenella sp.]|jgi:2-dehydro-3-deoxyphosphogluconate aldolase/(4S)-4-hydroxy-2-oxoglutarate aldolase